MVFSTDNQRKRFFANQPVQSLVHTDSDKIKHEKHDKHILTKLIHRTKETAEEHAERKRIDEFNKQKLAQQKEAQLEKIREQKEKIHEEQIILAQVQKDPKLAQQIPSIKELMKEGKLPRDFEKSQKTEQKNIIERELDKNITHLESINDELEKNQSSLSELFVGMSSLKNGIEREPDDQKKVKMTATLANLQNKEQKLEKQREDIIDKAKQVQKEQNTITRSLQGTAFGTVTSRDADLNALPKGTIEKREREQKRYLEQTRNPNPIFPKGSGKRRYDPTTGEFTSRLPTRRILIGFDEANNPIFTTKKSTEQVKTEPEETQIEMPEEETEKIDSFRISPRFLRET